MTSYHRTHRRVAFIGGAVVLLSSLMVGGITARSVAAGFLVLSGTTWLAVVAMLGRIHADDGPATLGLATHLTLLRGLLVSLVAGFIVVTPQGCLRWLPGVLYGAAALIDRYDGKVARRLGQVTALGARLDVAMDGLGLLVAPLVGVIWRRLPPWYLLVGAAYYLFHGGLLLRRALGLSAYVQRLRPNRITRFFAGVQMTLVAVALLPVSGTRTTTVAATVLMVPTLVFFARDWLIVTGQVRSVVGGGSDLPGGDGNGGGTGSRVSADVTSL